MLTMEEKSRNPFVQLVPDNSSSVVDYRTVTSYRCMAVNFPSGADIEISWYMRTEFSSPIKLHDFTYKEGCEIKIVSWLEDPAQPAFGAQKFSELSIINVTYMFDGKLVCSTTWDGEIYDTSVNISVIGEPEIHTSGTVPAQLGAFTEVVCNVTSRPPSSIVNWFINSTRMDFYSRKHGIRNTVIGVTILSRLTIFRVTHTDFGVYTCQAENDYGVQSGIINLQEQIDCTKHMCEGNRECKDGIVCICKHGYRTDGDMDCIDVNECSGRHGCEQDCKDTPGSFMCACFAGYTLAEDGKTCQVYHALDTAMLRSLLVGIGMGASAVVLVGVAVVMCVCYRRHLDVNKQLIDRENDSMFGSVLYTRHERLTEIDVYETVERLSDEFPRDRLRFLEQLGNGTFGAVFKAEALSITGSGTWEVVAVKLCRECATDLDKEDLYNELMIVKKIPGHVNVVSFYGCCTIGDPLVLIMEYAPCGNLLEFLRNRRPENLESHAYDNDLTAKDLLSFALQSARGMAHLSHNSIMHRDVAARNVLIGTHQICKISDFGLARDVEGIDIYERTSKGPLPIRWMAPESLMEGIHSHKSDVWSYGVLLWEIVTLGASPYADQNLKYVIEAVNAGKTLDKPQHCTAELYDLMCLCWFMHPANRPGFSSICGNLEWLLEKEADYIQLDQFQEHIYTVLEPDTMEERL
ncbi:fibroblast growth factor receptor 3-like [Gigantopelta aegis]|uniref:fibroblast growth factor receptor 3-like n=1 Tax=Gigantopelta aegis TaxID=1735272 RepID=UPI001B889634|nr:fibroblast growth factor receptor 3-like [Gigantopelta aegis]